VRDGLESVAVDVVSVGGWAGHVALEMADIVRTVCKEVGAAKL
jgi:hypothetical protein